MQALDIVVLAAGQGTRMRSALPKVLHKLGGKPMLRHVIDTARSLEPRSIQVVVGHDADRVQDTDLGDVSFTLQEERKGTGHAVMQGMQNIESDSVVLVLYGDVPLVSKKTLEQCVAACRASKGVALITANFDDPGQLGRIKRVHGGIQAIIEYADASDNEREICEINSGILCAPADYLSEALGRLEPKNAQGEYYLTDIIADAVANQRSVIGLLAECPEEVTGVNDRIELARLERFHQRRLVDQLMSDGVSFADPARVDLRGEVSIGRDSYVDINVILQNCTVGECVEIGAGSVIVDTTLGNGTLIHPHTVMEGAEVGVNCELGPFTRVRPNTQLGERVKLGNFVEVKKTTIGNGTKASHLTYLGDAELGADCNIGAGTVTCNYDGVSKHKTDIGDDVFVGTNSTLVAPITVGDESYIAAGSTVTSEIKAKDLAVGRARQRNIENWTPPKRRKQE